MNTDFLRIEPGFSKLKNPILKKIKQLIQSIQINVPFTMLYDTYLDLVIQMRINPEIGLDAEALDRFSPSDFRRIAEKLDNHNLTITLHGPFADLSAGSTDPAVRALTQKRFNQVLKVIPIFKPRVVTCHAGYDRKRYGYHWEAWLDHSLDLWSWFAAGAQKEGARLMLENVYEDGPDDLVTLFERLKPYQVGFCLDTGHLSAYGQSPLKNWVKSLESYLGQVHLHDNNGKNDDHLALGQGRIDFKWLLTYLGSRTTPAPIITLEPHKEEDLQPSLDYLQSLWPW